MKKQFLIFTVCLLALTQFASAQDYKFFVGGSVGFETSGNSEVDASRSSFEILPYAGYFVSEKMIVGLGLGYSGVKDADDSDNYTSTGLFNINPFARYRTSPSEKFGLYGEFGLNVGLGNSKIVVGGNDAGTGNTTNIGVYLGPGVDYAIADRWVINALWGALSYNNLSIKDVDGSSSNFAFGLNPRNIRFSLNYMF